MSQEAAMEQYIEVLSESIPEWMHGYSAVRLFSNIMHCLKPSYVLIDIIFHAHYMPLV